MDGKTRVLLAAAVVVALVVAALLANRFAPGASGDPLRFPETGRPAETAETAYVYVDIKGAVARPGVYKVRAGTRLYQLVSEAGGLTLSADASAVNLATVLHDQSLIFIPAFGEETADPAGGDIGKISLSHAPLDTLVTLPNIGPVTAARIIDYREEHGPFATVEDVMNVSGVGAATLDAIRPFVVP